MTTDRSPIEITAPDVQQAILRAQLELGVGSDQLYVEVVDEGDPEVGRQARVRAFLQDVEGAQQDLDLEAVCQVVRDLLGHMDINGEVTGSYGQESQMGDEPPIMVDIHGEDLGLLIGSSGETLDALQFIARIMVVCKYGKRVNLVLDVDGYKVIREQQLQRLSHRVADQVIQQGRAIALEPMPPRERRIIHIALKDYPQVTTESTGEGEGRRVTIQPES